jgi:3-phenylpropionate/cinnamic acid dioxygenase small subunit
MTPPVPIEADAPGVEDWLLHRQVNSFLINEAHLLDDKRFEEWLALFDVDGMYWAPVDPLLRDPTEGLSHIAEDIVFLTARVRRLSEPTAYSEQPSSRMCRLVANVAIEEMNRSAALIVVRSKLAVMEFRVRVDGEDESRTFAATVHHCLRPEGGRFRIVQKRVDLINSDAAFYGVATPF